MSDQSGHAHEELNDEEKDFLRRSWAKSPARSLEAKTLSEGVTEPEMRAWNEALATKAKKR